MAKFSTKGLNRCPADTKLYYTKKFCRDVAWKYRVVCRDCKKSGGKK